MTFDRMIQTCCENGEPEAETPVFANLHGDGSPMGQATPDYIGQFYLDTNVPSAVWVSTGTTNLDWLQVVGELTE